MASAPRRQRATADGPGAPVKSALRVLRVLETFAQARAPLPLSELARRLDIPVSACHGLVRTLGARGYLYETAPRRGYYPTLRWLDQARVVAAHDPLLERVGAAMEELARLSGETVVFATRAGAMAVYLRVVESASAIRYSAQAGDLRPLHASSVGKALLMRMSVTERRAALGGGRLARITARTITRGDRLEAELAASAARGFSESRGEHVPDVHAVAVPLAIGSATHALAIAGPAHRMADGAAAHARLLLRLSRSLEGSGGPT
ncbi:MAG: IclR family transcriptional regulator [Burkholderiales bacterium]|nr:IclR family transcriptional regulator [Burkholderiales bacterium]